MESNKTFLKDNKQVEPKTERAIIGWVAKDMNYRNALSLITKIEEKTFYENFKKYKYHLSNVSNSKEYLYKLGVLELWCNPVYSEPTLEERIKAILDKYDLKYEPLRTNILTDLANLLKTEKNG